MSYYYRCEYPCPKCGGRVSEEPSCAGYPGKGRLADGRTYDTTMVCSPPCGGATEFACDDMKGCGWWLREPNRRHTSKWNWEQKKHIEMGPRPEWMDAWEKENSSQDDDYE